MSEITPQNLTEYLIRLNDAAKANDSELLLKLIILHTKPNIFYGEMSRITNHAGILKRISPNLKGNNVYFAGDLIGTKVNNKFELQPGGFSLTDTGYETFVESRILVVHGLMEVLFGQIDRSKGCKLKKI